MGNGFDNAKINAKTCFQHFFAVASDRTAADFQVRILFLIEGFEGTLHAFERLPLVGFIERIEQGIVFTNQRYFCGGRTCINAQVSIALIGVQVAMNNIVLCMAFPKTVVFLLIAE